MRFPLLFPMTVSCIAGIAARGLKKTLKCDPRGRQAPGIPSAPLVESLANLGRRLLGARLAIIQGGIGVISAAAIGMDEPDFFGNFLEANIRAFRRKIRKARDATKGILGVNIMVAPSTRLLM